MCVLQATDLAEAVLLPGTVAPLTLLGAKRIARTTARRLNNAVLEALVRRYLKWVARDAPRRAVGCSVILLPQSERKLIGEIA